MHGACAASVLQGTQENARTTTLISIRSEAASASKAKEQRQRFKVAVACLGDGVGRDLHAIAEQTTRVRRPVNGAWVRVRGQHRESDCSAEFGIPRHGKRTCEHVPLVLVVGAHGGRVQILPHAPATHRMQHGMHKCLSLRLGYEPGKDGEWSCKRQGGADQKEQV